MSGSHSKAPGFAGGYLQASAAEVTRLAAFRKPCTQGSYLLFEYARAVRAAGGELTVSGMDPQLSGAAPRELLVPRLRAALGDDFTPEHEQSLNYFLPGEGQRSWETVRTAKQRRENRTRLHQLSGLLRSRFGVDGYWAKILDGLLFLDEDHWDFQQKEVISTDMLSLRDRHMGQNALWLIAQHPQDRFIVWAATSHLLRRSWRGIHSNGKPDEKWDSRIPMGQWLADTLGEEYFVLGVSASRGEVGFFGRKKRWPIEPLVPGMVEYGALSGSTSAAFIDRQRLRHLGVAASHLSGQNGTADWSQLLDGVWVIDEDRPLEPYASCVAALQVAPIGPARAAITPTAARP